MAANETAFEQTKQLKEIHAPLADPIDLVQSYEVDVLSQFKANLQQVEELNSRLRFVLGEVSHLVKKAK